MAEETTKRTLDAAGIAEEHVFRHLGETERIELRTIGSTAAVLNIDPQTVRLAVNRLERDGRIFGEQRGDGLETWRTEHTPSAIASSDL
jgi:hypothetical protein